MNLILPTSPGNRYDTRRAPPYGDARHLHGSDTS